MRLVTVPSNLLEALLALGNRLPVPIAETFGSMMLARAVEGANNLGIFNHLGKRGPQTAEDICRDLSLNEQITPALLHALAGSHYLTCENGRYRNTDLTQRFLVEGSPQYVGNFIRYNEQQRMIWLGLEYLARSKDLTTGKQQAIQDFQEELKDMLPSSDPVYNVHHTLKSKRIWHNYMYGLRDLANLSIPELQLQLRFPSNMKRLLDIGGGHGAYSIWMCKRYPQLRSTIYDLENAAEVGREIVAREGLSHRIEYVIGDITQLEAFDREAFDVAFCFNLVHHLTPTESKDLLRKISNGLNSRGHLVLWDEFRDSSLKEDQLARLIGVMFLLASGGDTYSFAEVTDWMTAVGFGKVKQLKLKSAPGTGMLWGRKG